jgi:serine/threonine-protein kinase
MAGESDDLDKLFESVADGESVDWDALERQAPDEETRALIRQLRLIAEVAEVHRSQVDEVTPDVELTAPATGGVVPIQPAIGRRVLPDLDTTPGGGVPSGKAPGRVPPGRVPPGTVTHEGSAPGSNFGTWGHLLLVRKIGEGSYGEVFHAHDTWLDHPVALKLLKPEAESRVPPAQLLHEARKLARVRHANVVTVHGADRHNGRVGFWMDFIDGDTLAARVSRGSLSAGEATSIGLEICRALAAVHRANIIHRDVKAQNVMRAHDGGGIILMDFGAGEFVGDETANPQGTPLYMAPELFQEERASKTTDVYAAGVLLFHLVTNAFPVNGGSMRELREAHARGRRRRLRDERPDLPDWFVVTVEKAIHPDPKQRYESAGEMESWLSRGRPRDDDRDDSDDSGDGDRRVWSRPLVAALAACGLLVAFALVGAITSTFYYVSLGLSGQFQTESPLTWPIWGLRALLAPVVLGGGGTAVGMVLLTVLYRQVVMTVDPLKAAIEPAARRVSGFIQWVRGVPTATTAALLFLAQFGLLALTWWWFGDLLNAFDSLIVQTVGGDITPLSTANYEYQTLFRKVVSIEFIAMTAAWLGLLWMRSKKQERGGWVSLSGGIAATFITLILLVLPYRIVSHNEHERVQHRSETCYLVSQVGSEALLFCPLQQPPRNRVVRLDDPELERGGPEESVFTRVGASVNHLEVK